MKFKDFLRENSTENHAVLAFGRMNPPTTGHAKLVDKVKEIADKVGGSHHVVMSHSTDPKKNPLTAAQKLKHAKRFFPNTNLSVSDKESPTFLTQAARLHKQGVTHLHFVAGSDRVAEYKKKLAQYNGTHKDALFNFKKITVHNAGQRDPDSEGTEGMSASKMRAHATTGNFDEFKKGIPGHVKPEHAKELFNDVRKGSNIKESDEINYDFEDLLVEGVHDQSIFKAVFLAGGPGSGKDYVLDNTLAGHGLTEINSDKALEFLMDKEGLDKTMPATEADKRDTVRGKAKSMTELRQKLALLGRNGLIINGTGDDPEKIARIKSKLEEIGYDTSMLMVNTADEVSKLRNIERGTRGGRTVPEEIRKEKWDSVQAARPEFAKLFGQNYKEFDNSEDLRQAAPEVVKAKKEEMLELYKGFKEFVSTPPSNETAEAWVAIELHKKDSLPVPEGGAEQVPHPDSGAAEEAKKLGLQYYGFGRYGKNGEVTHRSVHDKLVEVQKEQPKDPIIPTAGTSMTKKPVQESIDEEFAREFDDFEYFDEDTKKVKLMRDKSGKVKKFVLRRAAAKEAHLKNGTVMPFKNGYVVKVNEENENVQEINIMVQERTNSSGTTFIGESVGSQRTTDSKGKASAKTTITEEASGYEKGTSSEGRTKITIDQIRSKQKAILQKESIDKGIEPGLSMAASGENGTRGVTKTKLLKKPFEEMTGDETGASIGDQKELQLKRQGINLKSFKANRSISS
jgi:cytidyltransferase-like protein